MNYSDKILLRASQIAYYLIDEKVINDVNEWLQNKKDETNNVNLCVNYTLSELYAHSKTFKEEIFKKIREVSELKEDLDVFIELDRSTVLSRIEKPAIRERVAEMYDIIDDIVNDRYGIGSWKLKSFAWNDKIGEAGQAGNLTGGVWNIDNFNSSSGDDFCAMVFETEDNNAIVAFRGSDAMATSGKADVNNTLTECMVSYGGLALGGKNATKYIA